MALKCPKCSTVLEVRLTAAPPMQADSARSETRPDSSVEELLNAIDDDNLEEGERKFVTETRERLAQYGSRIRMSEKQMAWLRRIAG